MIDAKSSISLRAIDWAVVNWSKKHNVMCHPIDKRKTALVNVHQSYKTMLSRWKRKLFDPFRRRARVTVVVDGVAYETTFGQLNFVVWLYTNGIYSYVHRHIEDIEHDMITVLHSNRQRRNQNPNRKRTELTKTPSSTCVAFLAPQKINF